MARKIGIIKKLHYIILILIFICQFKQVRDINGIFLKCLKKVLENDIAINGHKNFVIFLAEEWKTHIA